MKKIRVVHFITKLELGGAQINTIYTYEHLDDTRFEVFLISGPGGMLTDKVSKKERFIIIENVVRQINPLQDMKAFFQVRRNLKKIAPDIIHTHSSKAGIIGRMAAFSLRRKGKPQTVHTVHGFPFSPYQRFLKRKFFEWSEKIAALITDHFVFVSRDDIEIAGRKKILKRDNFSLIRSGFPLAKFQGKSKNKTALRAKYDIAPEAFVCGVIAPLKPQKGLFNLIEAAHEVTAHRKDVIFFIAGDGDLRPIIEAELKKRGIFENFRLPGFIQKIEEAIDIFDIGVSTALWEGLPQSIVQLRLKKKPVVASDIPGNREVIKERQNGFLVDVNDHREFAAKILYLMENIAERDRLAQYQEDFSLWDADFMVKAQENLYHSLVEVKTRRTK